MKTRLIIVYIILTVVSFMLIGQSSAKIDPKTAVGIWLFDDGKGDIATDSSGSQNDGTLTNGPKWVDGKFGKALELNGTNNNVTSPTNSFAEKGTISLWFNTKNGPGNQYLIAAGYPLYFAINNTGANQLGAWTSPGIPITASQAWKSNTWYHVAYVYDSSISYAALYINGSKEAENASQTFNISIGAKAYIGSFNDGVQCFFNGLIDEVGFFNVALTDDDIKNLTENGIERALGLASVFPKDKLAITWAMVKSQDRVNP
jgi:hypothetical protein